jgi:hypothetical protein
VFVATAVESAVEAPPEQFKPYVPDEVTLPELTVRALILGSVLPPSTSACAWG